MSARTIRMDRTVDASPDRVYRMWADADTMNTWLSYEVQGSLMPGTRSTLIFPRERLPIDVLDAIPNERFRFRWYHHDLGSLATEVTVSLRPRGYGTAITLTDGPYDTDDEPQLEAFAEAIEIWAGALANLRAQVDYSMDLRVRP